MNDLEDNEPPAKRNLARCAIVVLRWALVAGWFAFSALVQPGAEDPVRAVSQSLASAGLAFLLVNALWQHMPLKRACLVGAIAACGLKTCWRFRRFLGPPSSSALLPECWWAPRYPAHRPPHRITPLKPARVGHPAPLARSAQAERTHRTRDREHGAKFIHNEN